VQENYKGQGNQKMQRNYMVQGNYKQVMHFCCHCDIVARLVGFMS